METIEDIVADMRKRFEPYAKSDSNDARYVAYLGYAEFADRIEAAAKALEADRDNWRKQALAEDARANATTEKSSQVGNTAEIREALEELIANIEMRSFSFGLNVMVDTKTFLDAKTALSAPARNCDLYTTEDEAWEAFCEAFPDAVCPSEYWSEQYQMWLFAEAK